MASTRIRSVGAGLLVVALLGAGCATTTRTTADPPSAVDETPPPTSPAPTSPAAGVERTATPPAPAPSVPPVSPEPTEEPAALVEPDEPVGFEPFAVAGTIDTVDFLNGFTYATPWAGPITVQDGAATVGEFGDEYYVDFVVDSVVFGDLDGDGTDEAAVTTIVNTGGSGYFSSVDVYQIRNGLLEYIAIAAGGDRADGGVYDSAIVDGQLIIEQFGTDLGACCPTTLAQSRRTLVDGAVILLETYPPRAWLQLGGSGDVEQLRFLPGTSSAALTVYDFETEGRFGFDALQGQRFRLDTVSGPRPLVVEVTDTASGTLLTDIDADAAAGVGLVLPATGNYEVVVVFEDVPDRERSTLYTSIADARAAPQPTWVPVVDRKMVNADPVVTTLLVWPRIVGGAAQPSVLQAVNGAVEDFARSELAPWLTDLEVRPDAHSESMFELTYGITLVGPDLVSIHFYYYDYVCCRPYPNVGQRALIADLRSGRILELGEIIDLARLDDLQALWIAELERTQEASGLARYLNPGEVGFTSLSLVPHGIELGTDRGMFGGAAVGPQRTVLTFAELGDLVNPDLIARARAASLPEVPPPSH